MDKKYTKSNKKAVNFLKRNIYYIIMAVCILAIAVMVTLTIINKYKTPAIDEPIQTPDPVITDPVITDPDTDPVVTDPIVFTFPSNGTIFLDYSMDALVWHGTLRQYSVHDGIDFQGNEGDNVFAAYDGVVESVGLDPLYGNMVVINHGSGLKTTYFSLGEVNVDAGANVQKGQVIGTVGMTAGRDLSSGNHVHFMVTKNGEVVSPYNYFPEGDK